MIALLDDFTHVGLSCTRLDRQPSDRFAVVLLNCLLGESVDRTRIASLLFVLATLVILDRLFFRDRNWRRLALWAVQPLLLLPFFWASQITTAMTAFWAAVWSAVFVKWLQTAKTTGVLALISVLGATVRFEAFAYGVVFLGAYFLLNRDLYSSNRRKVIYGVAGSFVATLVGKGLLMLLPSHSPVITMIAMSNEAINEAHFYPLFTYPFLQLDSISRYFEALVFPWRLSFYGDWYAWWPIHQNLWSGVLRFLGLGLAISAIAFALRRDAEAKKSWLWACLFFVACTAMLSSLPRNDWYYPIRAYLGTLCFFIFFTPVLLKRPKLYALALMIGLSSTFAHVTMHFSSLSSFQAYESTFTDGSHPFMDLQEAAIKSAAGESDPAIQVLHQLYEKIPIQSAQVSTRAGSLWTLGLYQAWVIYEKTGNQLKADEVLKVLGNSTFYPAVHACLQAEQIPVENCLSGDRVNHFCASLGVDMPKLEKVRDYRIDVAKVCQFDPIQK